MQRGFMAQWREAIFHVRWHERVRGAPVGPIVAAPVLPTPLSEAMAAALRV